MKTVLVSGIVLVLFTLDALAQPAGFGGDGRTEDGYSITERGPHHRIWERREIETTLMGTQVERKRSYTELETGMHYWEDNHWKEAVEEIEIVGDHALATKGAHKVIFKANFVDVGVVDLLTPDEQRFRSHLLGLSYFDSATGQAVLIAEPKECFGQVLPPNQVFYLDAFDDVVADVRYTYTKAGCEQDVIIRAQLPDPAALGLNPETTRLQIFTEFIEAPLPVKQIIPPTRPGGLPDERLDFSAMTIGEGKAFTIGEDLATARPVRVAKQWVTLEGRTFLIEEVPLPNINAALQHLPPGRTASATPPRKGKSENALLALQQLLPQRLALGSGAKPVRWADAGLNRRRGFVLDYSILSSTPDFTLQAGMTYYCTNTVNFSGTTRIEGGTVVKLSSNTTAQININGNLVWATASYRPAIFTAKDDNSTGETISGSTGTPTGYYGGGVRVIGSFVALNVLSNLCLFHLRNALDLGSDDAQLFTLSDAQFVKCNAALALVGSLNVNNVLFHQIATNFNSSAGESLWVGHHLTVNQCGTLNNAFKATIALTNSLLVAVTNLDASGYYWLYTNKVVLLTSDSGVFQTIGGGAHYLAGTSPYRNIGTTNLDATLLADLGTKTTYPPLAFTNTTFPAYGTFHPQVQRDTDVPDLGYHYDPLDYLVGGVDVNVNTTFAPGTAVGWFRYNQGWYHAGHGLHVADCKTLTFDGLAEQPSYFVHQTAVQENRIGYTTMADGPGGITGWATNKANRPYLNLQFTRCAGLPIYRNHFRDDWGGLHVSANHSEFHGGGLGGYVSDAGFTNCLLDRTGVWLEAGNTNYADVFAFRNCTVRGGTFSINRQSSTEGRIQTTMLDSAFDNTSVSTSDPHASNASLTRYDYNAYLTNASRTYPNGAHDVLVNTFNWQSGWLGNFYLPTNSSLINTGSVADAASVGLYHFTSVTNQVKETNSTVDIGYHYVVLDTNNVPVDTDTGGVADYLEDANGSGTVNGTETDWTSGHGHDDKDHKVNKHLLTPGYLRCEYRVDPWGVDAKDPWTGQQKPRLYWIVTSQRRAAKQVAYRILVASSPENLNANYGDMWDSGRVCSDQTIHVEYNGATLQSGQRLWWKVKTWELFSGKALPWSTNAFFQMGLLSTNDWTATWLTTRGSAGTSISPMYRKRFQQKTNDIKRATAYVSARGVYEFWVNGQRIGQSLLPPEWTYYNKRVQYQTFDITTNLMSSASTDGTNHVVGAIVGEGWFSGRSSQGDLPNCRYTNGIVGGFKQFLLQLKIERNDGSVTNIVTDHTWTCNTNGPIGFASIVDGETYDANKAASVANWNTFLYSGESMYFTAPITNNALIVTQMVAQPNDPIQIVETRLPIDVWTNRNGSVGGNRFVRIYDMGQNMDGWCSISLINTNYATTNIVLRHAESLVLDSQKKQLRGANIDTNSLEDSNFLVTKAAQLDRYFILQTSAVQEFHPRFTYHGFRYVEVDAPEDLLLTTNSLVGFVIHSAVPITGSFHCSQKDVNQLVTNSTWSLRANLYGVQTGCSQRNERFGWLGDSDVFSQTACFLADMAAFYTKIIRDVRDEQYPPPTYFGQYSVNNPWSGLAIGDIGWSSGGVIKPWQLYQNYADTRMLAEHYISASNWVYFLEDQWPGHLFKGAGTPWSPGNGDWVNGSKISLPSGWNTANAEMSHDVHQHCHYTFSVDILASMSKVLQAQAQSRGDTLASTTYGNNYTYYANVVTACRSNFQRSATGPAPQGFVYYDGSGNITKIGNGVQGDYAHALYFNMIPENQRSTCMSIMVNGSGAGIRNYNDGYADGSNTNHLSTGIMATARAMLELTRNGNNAIAYQLLTDYRHPSWLYQITNGGAIYQGAGSYGATTTWEHWDGWVSGSGGGYHPNGSGNSFNHFWPGAVGEWVFRNVGGLNPDDSDAGFKNFLIYPRPGGTITNASASFNSIRGPIVCTWTNDVANTNFSLIVTVPANSTASVFVPSTELGVVTESGGMATNAPGVISYYVTNAATVFQVGSGTYQFNVPGASF